MNIKVVISVFLLIFQSFGTWCPHPRIGGLGNNNRYKVYKIDSINNYYLIYAEKKDTLFKIVSKKERSLNYKRIKTGSKYVFSLNSLWNKEIIIGGMNASPAGIPHVTCLSFDDSTSICLERDSINDLFYSENLKGLYLIKR